MYKINPKITLLPSSLHMKLIFKRAVPATSFVKNRRKYDFSGLKWSPAYHLHCTSIYTHRHRLNVNRRLWRVFRDFPELHPDNL